MSADNIPPIRVPVTFTENFEGAAPRRSASSLRVSFARLPPTRTRDPLVLPREVYMDSAGNSPTSTQSPRDRTEEPSFRNDSDSEGGNALKDLSSQAVLIYPKKIDDLHRFRLLFFGLLLFIVSSTQGLHSLFAVMVFERQYLYTVEQMTDVYLCGAAFGMFVFPFGMLYDWFGPRIVIILATLITALGHTLFALMFRGTIKQSPTKSAVFYAILSWGCYAFDVAVLPAILTHMPRDRGQPTGLLKTFSGLGSSFISCVFRGFFVGRFDNLEWFMLALTVVFGAFGAWYIDNAPYVTTRWQQRRLTPRKQLRNYLIRNRYMSQLMPRRRYYILVGVLILLNLYLTIQTVCVAYLLPEMTPGKYRGIAIGAIVIVSFIGILVLPIRAIDGVAPQDEEVIKQAKRKESELKRRRDERIEAQRSSRDDVVVQHEPFPPASAPTNSSKRHHQSDQEAGEHEDESFFAHLSRRYEPVALERPLVEVDIDERPQGEGAEEDLVARMRTLSMHATPLLQQRSMDVEACQPSTYANPYVETITVCGEVFVPPVYQTTFLESLTYVDIWLIFYTTLCVWGVGLTMTASWNIEVMVQARYANMEYKTYILFAAMAGVCTAGGRVFLGVYEQLLRVCRQRFGMNLVETVGYPVPSVGLFIACIFWIALPGDKVLILAYLLGGAFYGMSTSITIYVLGTVFDRDMGMHYGFCFLGTAIGMILFFRLAWFDTYKQNAVDDYDPFSPDAAKFPFFGYRCVGQRLCMNRAVGTYIAVTFSSIISSYLVHWRYKRLVQGKLKQRRVFAPAISNILNGRQNDSMILKEDSSCGDVSGMLSSQPVPVPAFTAVENHEDER